MREKRIYHGSNVVVSKPTILINGHYKDFGYGFYCTDLEKQAKRWAQISDSSDSVLHRGCFATVTIRRELFIMTNKYFPNEQVSRNDLYFICYMIERVARRLHQPNSYVANTIGRDELHHLLSVANVLHSENPLKVEDDWIQNYNLKEGSFDITAVDHDLVSEIPSPTQMGKVYCRLISDTLQENEDYLDGIQKVYNNEICKTIDNYNASAYYEPSYVIARAYLNGGF